MTTTLSQASGARAASCRATALSWNQRARPSHGSSSRALATVSSGPAKNKTTLQASHSTHSLPLSSPPRSVLCCPPCTCDRSLIPGSLAPSKPHSGRTPPAATEGCPARQVSSSRATLTHKQVTLPFFVLPAPPKKSQACGFGGFQTHGSHMSRGTDCWRESPSPKGRRQPPEWGVLGAQRGPHGTDTASPAGQATGLLRLQTGSPTTERRMRPDASKKEF